MSGEGAASDLLLEKEFPQNKMQEFKEGLKAVNIK